jgi:hypothetical protein
MMGDDMLDLNLKQTALILRLIYPFWTIIAFYGLMIVPDQMIDPDNAMATAANLLEHETLFRSGILASLLTQVIQIGIALLLFHLFVGVQRRTAFLLTILAIVSVPIAMLNEIFVFAALFSRDDPTLMAGFLRLQQQGIGIASIFWGLWLFPLGALIYKSGWFPKFVGVVVIIAGIGYLLVALLGIVSPRPNPVLDILEILTFGEVVWLLWLVIRGPKWSITTRTAL